MTRGRELVSELFSRIEPVFFCLLVFVSLIPVLASEYFPTVDGPSHLYNARLIAELWLSPGGEISEFLQFNPTFSPNWTGHLLLAALMTFTSAFWAEKIILTIYLIGLPLGIRSVLMARDVGDVRWLYLIFSFSYSYLFHYGFFNFNIGVVLFFFGLSFWLNNQENYCAQSFMKQGLIATLIALSHPFAFALYLVALFVLNLTLFLPKVLKGVESYKTILRFGVFQLAYLSVGILITTYFVVAESSLRAKAAFIAPADLFSSLKYVMPIKGIEEEAYHWPSKILLYMFGFGLILTAVKFFKEKKKFKLFQTPWFILTLVTLVLIFAIPDYLGSAGFISARLMLFFFFFLILFLAECKLPDWFSNVVFALSVALSVWSVKHNYASISNASKTASELVNASSKIEPFSTILTVTSRESKPFVHVSNYLAVDNPVILMYNYEAALPYFPLTWKYSNIYPHQLGEMSPSDCVPWIGGKRSGEAQQIDYICFIDEPEIDDSDVLNCQDELTINLKKYYQPIFESSSEAVRIYKRN